MFLVFSSLALMRLLRYVKEAINSVEQEKENTYKILMNLLTLKV